MPRPVLDEDHLHPAIRARIANYQQGILGEVRAAIAAHPVLVVGMRQNPFPKKARQALDAAAVTYHYLEYGSYFGMWRERLALKMWTGWHTFPMVFVKGTLIGGYENLRTLIDSGELRQMLA